MKDGVGNIGVLKSCKNRRENSEKSLGTWWKCIDKKQTQAYISVMKYFSWSSDKNEILKHTRGISFEEIVYLVQSGKILGIEENSRRSNQKMYILEIENYAVIVPFVEKDNEIFLKTAFPSRKYTKRYDLKGE